MKQQRWLRHTERITVWIIIICGIVLGGLVVAQFALQFAVVREWVTGVDRLEGLPFFQDMTARLFMLIQR
ncbi:hypothetical protein ACFOQM_19950 [Paenibacillus sp. GCM10012307]|uniref:Uncharacterized protein n=1 Tax=Paenibacillus roseus TaxID=2798579 RepID=A0A934JAY8_9BACL|nr:hypothetical protein [Paenibacillus roseus]MBJ6363500.1 hypothetical protein [Paenibacillus roseus]